MSSKRRSSCAAIINRRIRLIHNHQQRYPRIIRRREAKKRSDMHIADNASFLVDLRCTCFAADAVAGHSCVFRAADADHLLEKFAHGAAGILADGRGNDFGLRAVQHRAVRSNHFLKQIGFHEPSAVNDRAGRGQQLNWRDSNALPKTDSGQIYIFDIPLGDQDACRLALKINPRTAAQTKGVQVLIKPLRTQPQRQLHKYGVAAVLQRLRHGFGFVRASPAADGIPVNGDFGGAIERVLRRGHASVERSRSRQDFER